MKKKGKGFMEEFKKFILRGNVLDMAVGVIVGGAFTAIVTSLNKDVITPFLGLLGGMDFSDLKVTLMAGESAIVDGVETVIKEPIILAYGNFLTAVVNFLITAFVIFVLVKSINALANGFKKKEEEVAPPAPTTKTCPYCLSEIPLEAKKCAHCTSDLEA